MSSTRSTTDQKKMPNLDKYKGKNKQVVQLDIEIWINCMFP